MNNELFLTLVVVLLAGQLVYITYAYDKRSDENRLEIQKTSRYITSVATDLASYKLYNPENKDKLTTQGLYFSGDGYYCVKTEGRDYTDIKLTDAHESCHWFVDMDYQHFCNDSNETRWDIEKYMGKGE